MEETKNLIGNYASKAAQSTLLRSVYVWMTLALIITGFVSMYERNRISWFRSSSETDWLYGVCL